MLHDQDILISPTPSGWVEVALSDFDHFLIDHAACERKAAALCMSFVAKYPDRPALVEPMVSLAREELEHFQQVYRLLTRRGLMVGPDEKDPYVNGLLAGVRHGREERLLDRLIISGLIEARGCERFQIVAQHLEDEALKDFYATLARAEAGHCRVFMRIAERYFEQADITEAFSRLRKLESEVMLSVPFRAALH